VDVLVVLVVVVIVAWLLMAPLRAGALDHAEREESAERAELEALKEAKYREIRDAELDHRTGKLSDGDWRSLDRDLRAEAVELLRRLDALEGREGAEQRQ
jgi:flagellar biosynthesis/type III secretory pathway M-ring protein FliF/YscJ